MQIGINDLDDDDILETGLEPEVQEPSLNEPPHLEEEGDFMSDFLKTRGIDDMNKINFLEEDGSIVEKSWKDLSNEEKFNILNMPLEERHEDNNELTDEEIALLSQIRQSNLSPLEYLQLIAGEPIDVTPQYKIDDLSDDEVYLLDLESRVGELSDDEAAEALNTAKANEAFFQKQVEGIRKEYKEREDLKTQQEEAQREQELQEAFENYQAQVVDAINGFTSIGNFDLNFEDADKEELAEFMLSRDLAGKNYLFEALQDPETLTRAAWFILNGEEAFNNISDYFAQLIKLISENQYKKGFEEGKSGKAPTRPTVVISLNNKNQRHEYNSINDLDDDE